MTKAYVNRPRAAGLLERMFWPLDRVFDRLYGSAYNPFYHSGALAFWLLIVVVATGVYLLFFWRIGAPYDSMLRIDGQAWTGRWIRTLHRYASDAALIAIAFHTLRMMVQGRTWGPRMLAWVSGVVMLGLTLITGWTGFIMMWDRQGQQVASELTRMVDVLPIFSEPISRAFIRQETLPFSFFFLNLWIHVSLPLLMVLFLWVHTIRAARPQLNPPRRLVWVLVAALAGLSLAWPAPLPGRADLMAMAGRMPLDLFYNFWLPLAQALGPELHLASWSVFWVAGFAVPWWWVPGRPVRGEPAVNDEALCTGCGQCYQDCPYEAIAMVPRLTGKGSELVSRIDPAGCVSCGICAGSCAPMVIGPPGRSGKDQLREVELMRPAVRYGSEDVFVFACRRGIGAPPRLAGMPGVQVLELNCGGELHSTVVEYLVRSGVGGVMVMACPERNCVHREGPRWLRERFYFDREAELKPRVDKSRVRLAHVGASDTPAALEALRGFQAEIRARAHEGHGEERVDIDLECDPLELEVSHG
jgi:ferredoxin